MITYLRYTLNIVTMMRAIYSHFTTSALCSFVLGGGGGGGGASHQPAYAPNQAPGGNGLGAIGSILGGVLGGGGHHQQQPGYQPSGGYGGYPSGGYGGQQGSGGSDLISGIGSAIGSSLFSSALDGLNKRGKEVKANRFDMLSTEVTCANWKRIINTKIRTAFLIMLRKLFSHRNLTMNIVPLPDHRLRVTNHRHLQNQPRVRILHRLPAGINYPRTKFRKDSGWTIKCLGNVESRGPQVHAK